MATVLGSTLWELWWELPADVVLPGGGVRPGACSFIQGARAVGRAKQGVRLWDTDVNETQSLPLGSGRLLTQTHGNAVQVAAGTRGVWAVDKFLEEVVGR